MAMELTITADYAQAPDTVFADAIRFGEMKDAMRGIAVYRGIPDGAAVQGQTYIADVTFLGVFKNTGHRMFIERLDQADRVLQSRESSPSVIRWDHTLTIQPSDVGARWTDCVVIDAGRNTWLMARMGRFIYTRRHKHRSGLNITRALVPLPG